MLAVEWGPDASGRLRPFIPDRPEVRVAWAPQPGSQQAFIECPVTEALFEGGRGNGKTDTLLMSYAQHVGCDFGTDWRGIIFRRTVPELQDIIGKAQRWFTQIFPRADFNETKKKWTFPTGETLTFSELERPNDYFKYHGHEYTFLGFEELTNWATPECYTLMFSCLRSSNPHVPRMVRANCNPSGVGHNWVKARFKLPVAPGRVVGPIIRTDGEPDRVAIHGTLQENQVFLQAEPKYVETLTASAKERGPGVLAAWRDGSWDITAGGMVDDLWKPEIHVVMPIPLDQIPARWRLDRAYDHGQSRPFSVGWWAQSNGEPLAWTRRVIDRRTMRSIEVPCQLGTVRGDLIRVREWYGWNGTPNKGCHMSAGEIAQGIIDREVEWGVRARVKPGPADTAIFNPDASDDTVSVASKMEAKGVAWVAADKGPGSRDQGWQVMRELLFGAIPDADGFRENPGLYVTEDCEHFIRTIPVLPRSEKNPDDVNTDSEDHIADESRYRCRVLPKKPQTAGGTARVHIKPSE